MGRPPVTGIEMPQLYFNLLKLSIDLNRVGALRREVLCISKVGSADKYGSVGAIKI